MLEAGAVPASSVPDASLGRTDIEEFAGADAVEDRELQVYALAGVPALAPRAVGFLDGIELWRVEGYSGVTPIVRAHVAAAIRRRGPDRRLRTVAEAAEELAITRLDRLSKGVRRALEEHGVRVVEIPAEDAGRLDALGPDEWLVVDGVISDSPALSAHPRTLGVVKSHGAQYFEGAELERALTLPADHRTGVFCPKSRGARREIHSWYLRLWPWEGNDLLYGLVRLEARAHPDTVALAPAVSAWLLRERAPLATP
ncbi:MAG: hypothetical protein DMD67_10550 [Gemmatimonadetes bacterium]|nr:MAG: hypothetical protein DMD67_10550 [Gemmatimonadota bacterium]